MPILRVSQGFYDRVKQAKDVLSDMTERDISFPEITDKIILAVVVSEHPAVMIEGNAIVDDFGWGIKPIILQVSPVKRKPNRRASIEFERTVHDTPKIERSPMTVTHRFKEPILPNDHELI